MECCTGKILDIDLSAGTTRVSTVPDEVYEMVLGGNDMAGIQKLVFLPTSASRRRVSMNCLLWMRAPRSNRRSRRCTVGRCRPSF